MLQSGSILIALAFGLSSLVNASPHSEAFKTRSEHHARSLNSTCKQIAEAISPASNVWWPLSFHFTKDVSHWAASSSDFASCSVEPGTAEDVGKILQIVGANKTPFAVKGGGHTSNPGFSSTSGVQIAMSKFSEVNYNADAQTVDVGSGLVWDDVYSALEPHGVNVVGGRVTGVGVAGFTLGGGYSWLSNERGLTVDNVVGYELVLPNGTVTQVTQSSNPDLFFALKGGYNNFGIVTKFTLKTYPQGQVWGGLITITADQLDKVNAATVKFASNVSDPKAAVLPTYNFVLGAPGVSLLLFYNGPNPPAGIFDDYLAIPHFTKDVSTRSFLSLVKAAPSDATAGTRGIFHTVPIVQYTPKIMDAILNETKFWGPRLSLASATFVSYDVEPFLPTIFTHADASSSAYPPSRARGLQPNNIYFAWGLSASDDLMHDAARKSAQQLTNVALSEGQDIANAPLYGNYAIFDTPIERIFGSNLDRLKSIKAQYDPANAMGLAGGWKI
ncbi:FAD dependent oxidoreductase [Panus rudis PR-1116 ss-1]|nr:FAD dependent oxidoreductase [Panus rudis PR-1116 ss-1]